MVILGRVVAHRYILAVVCADKNDTAEQNLIGINAGMMPSTRETHESSSLALTRLRSLLFLPRYVDDAFLLTLLRRLIGRYLLVAANIPLKQTNIAV